MFANRRTITFSLVLTISALFAGNVFSQSSDSPAKFERAIEHFVEGEFEKAQIALLPLDTSKDEKALHYVFVFDEWKKFSPNADEVSDQANQTLIRAFIRSEYPYSVMRLAKGQIDVQNAWALKKRTKQELLALQEIGLLEAFRLYLLASPDGRLQDGGRAKLEVAWESQKESLPSVDRLFWKTLIEFMRTREPASVEAFYGYFEESLRIGDPRVYELACRWSLRDRLISSRPLEKLRSCIFSSFFGGSTGDGQLGYFSSPTEIDDAWDWSKPNAFVAVEKIRSEANAAIQTMAEKPGTIVFLASNWCKEQGFEANKHQFCIETSAVVHHYCVEKAYGLDLAPDFTQSRAYGYCRRYSFQKELEWRGDR